jgi:drug/metabolite transporter (DMT)-like permease
MSCDKTRWVATGSTALFVLLWGSGAIFSRWGLDHASAFAFLVLRFALAFGALLAVGLHRRRWLPRAGTRARVALTGLLLIGGYSSCYFLALERGVTPGVLATVLGIQPILTLVVVERRFSHRRAAGLALALAGLILVVYHSIEQAHFSATGMLFALGALGSMTAGAILQKSIAQPPAEVLPLQIGVSLLLCSLLAASRPVRLDGGAALVVSLAWLGLVISVGAQLLFYRLIRAGNLVNVTSLFYLVPAVTAAMDHTVLGNRLSPASLAGMAAILLGVALVFRTGAPGQAPAPAIGPRRGS